VRTFPALSRPARRPGSTSAGSETEGTLQPNHRRINLTCTFRQWQLTTGLLNSRRRETVPRRCPGSAAFKRQLNRVRISSGVRKAADLTNTFIQYMLPSRTTSRSRHYPAIARYGRSLDDRSVHYSLSRCNTFFRHKNVDVMPWRRENRPRCKRPADTVVIGLRKRGGNATACLDQARRPI